MEEKQRQPPRRVKMCDAYEYIRKHFPETGGVSRMTPYNWAKIGIRGTKLKTMSRGWKMFTTKDWINDFLADTYTYR